MEHLEISESGGDADMSMNDLNLKFFKLKVFTSKENLCPNGPGPGPLSIMSTEGDFKAALKELNVQDVYSKSPNANTICPKLVAFVREELLCYAKSAPNLQSCSNDDITCVLVLIKTLVEFHGIPSPSPSSLIQQQEPVPVTDESETDTTTELCSSIDPYFTHILQHLLVDLLKSMNQFIYPYCEQLSDQLQTSSTTKHASIGTTTHQILCLVHKTTRITLSLLKRILQSSSPSKAGPEPLIFNELKTLNEILCKFIRNETLELPLDVKCNIGLGICYIMKIHLDESLNELGFYETLFTKTEFKFLENMTSECNITINRLAMVFGLLETTKSSEENFLEKMKVIGKFLFSIDHGTKEGINLGSARVLELWINKLTDQNPESLKVLLPLFPEVEFFIFSYIPGHIDAVKNCCRNILRDLVKIYDKLEGDCILQLFNQVMLKPSHIKWIAVACICETSPKSIRALETFKNLPINLLCSKRTMKNAATDAYLALMSYHFLELDHTREWESIWIDPLFTEQKVNASETNWPQKRVIMNSILKSKNESIVQVVLESVLKRLKSFDDGDLSVSTSKSSCSTESLLLAVEAVKLGTELKIKLKQASPLVTNDFHGIVPRTVLHSWLWSNSLQIRLASFSLLVDSKKTSELIPSEDLESIRILLTYSIVSQNPAFRQHFISYFKRLLKRLYDSRNLLIRTKHFENLEYYANFLNWLWNFLVHDEGLFPGSNFGRRYQALECLAELTSTFDFNVFGVEAPKDLNFLRWLVDSYETNKVLAFRILEKIPLPALENMETTEKLLETVCSFCESTKPPDSVTGRFLGLFLIKKCPIQYPPIKVLNLALQKLQEMYELIGNSSLIEVASQTQMYGYIRFIRTIITETKLHPKDIQSYRQFTTKLIELGLKFKSLLLPVLGNAAPEGFLPGLPDSSPQSSNIIRSLNAQMLLVCSWRSMKDLCLLLTDLCIILPLETDVEGEKFVITLKQVQIIGDHLLYLLKNLMHRGVFEQAYLGFRQLAGRLFRSNSGKLNELPEKWLNDAMDKELINSKCITRRSAGLPFIFQALMYPLCGHDSLLAKYINRLFIPESQNDGENTNSTLVRIHCSNVLRGLFRDANFSRGIMPYVPQGIQTAFRALKAPTWDERNSGLMLYGAVIRRTFGPKLNLMSAPTFFRKFPSMYDFLIDELTKCILHKPSSSEFDLTYHVLLLLSSFASTGVVEDGHFKLAEYVPLIKSCGSSKDIHVRNIAGKALIPFLIHPPNKVEFLLELLKELDCVGLRKGIKTNKLHGDLIQFNLVLRSIPTETDISQILLEFNRSLTQSNHWIWRTKCPIIYETLAEICMFNIEKFLPVLIFVKKHHEQHFGSVEVRRSIPGLPNADQMIYKGLIQFDLQQATELELILTKWFEEKDLVFIEQLVQQLLQQNNKSGITSNVLTCAIQRYLLTDFPYRAQLNIEESLLEYLSNFPSPLYALLSSDQRNELFIRLLEICEDSAGTMDIKGYAVTILGKIAFLDGNTPNTESKERFCTLLSNWADSTSDIALRIGVAKAIACIESKEALLKNFTLLQTCKLWFTTLSLIQDDDMDVRQITHTLDTTATGERNEICDRKSLEQAIHGFLNTFACQYPAESVVLLIGLVLREDFEIKLSDTDDNDEDRLFDKSEMNNFNEPTLLLKILKQYLNPDLKAKFTNHFQNTPISGHLMDIYILSSNSSNLEEPTTLKSIAKKGIIAEAWDPYTTDSQFERLFIQSYICKCIFDLFD